MKEPSSGTAGNWATLKAAWKASNGPQGREINPTLYSTEHLARWLPLKFLTAMPVLLSLIVFWNLVFLLFGIEGVLTEWFDSDQAVAILFYLCSYQLVLFPWSCADLHKRRKRRLRPKRIIITAGSALLFLMVAIGLWAYSYFIVPYDFWFYTSWGVLHAIDLSPLLPIFAIVDATLYAVYLSFGLVALIRDYRNKPLREVYSKYVDHDLPQQATPIDISDPERASQGHVSYTRWSSTYDSSIAQISCQTSMTMPLSTGVSSSLVTTSSTRSSAVISSDSSQLPAYSGRSSATHSERDSVEEQTQLVVLSCPRQAHLRS